MAKSVVNRRLTAILAADVVGFTGLMQKDEVGTLERLKSLRKELVQPKLTEFTGRIVKLMGDGLLAEFPSIVEAVHCAVDIQQSMVGRENELPDESSIKLRIGVNLGDIIVDGQDIYGDGVNVASRLEGLADPGGVCISAKAYEEVKTKASIQFEDLGEKMVKNIEEPLRVYRWTGADDDADSTSDTEGVDPTTTHFDKPSIAVLPFDNMSGDPEQEYFSDGITEDVITELSRFRSLFVIARNSSFIFKGTAVDVTEVGKKLGVSYVVEGSVRKVGNHIRVTAQLIEASTGNHLWAERYDRDIDDIFTVQDEVASKISTMVPGQVEKADYNQARQKPVRDINAYDLLLQSKSILDRNFGDREGEKLLKQALEIEPEYARPHAILAAFYSFTVFAHGSDINEATSLAKFHAEAAHKLDPDDPIVQQSLATTYAFAGDHTLAHHHILKAIALNPNDYQTMLTAVMVMSNLGDFEQAVEWANRAAHTDPYPADAWREIFFDLYYMKGEYETALDYLVGWQDYSLHILLAKAATLAQLNRIGEAQDALQLLEKNRPENWDIVGVMNAYVRMCALPESAERWLEGFRKAGLDI